MEAAQRHVPESRQLATLAAFYRGLQLLTEDKASAAVPYLKKTKAAVPNEPFVDRLLLTAEAGAAFDAGDYALFLERQKALAKLDPTDAMAEAGVASAYACQYAVSGQETLRQQAVAQLARAAKLVKDDPAPFEEYERRIRHRLETREIISREEFLRRFP
jgi:hypothetical protein